MRLSLVLKKELERRKSFTPSYSVRKFARDLDISPAQLSQLISEKRNISDKILQKISKSLELSSSESKQLRNISGREPTSTKNELREDHFKLISDWYHFAILSLSEIKGSKADSRYVSKKFGISLEEANEAIFRLRRLGLIKIHNDDTFEQVQKDLHIESKTKNESIQKYHTQNLRLSEYKLKTIEPERREFSSMTMAIDPSKLARARTLINQFKEDMTDLLEAGNKKEVYQLSIQLFPLSILEDKK